MKNHSEHNHDHKQHKHQEHKNHQHGGHGSHDHSGHHAMMITDFRKRFWVSLIATIPILVLSPLIQGLLGYSFTFSFSGYVLFSLISICLFLRWLAVP